MGLKLVADTAGGKEAVAAVFFLSFFTAVISTCIHSHTIRFHFFISTYVVKLVAGTIL
jgi:hypothetical protein